MVDVDVVCADVTSLAQWWTEVDVYHVWILQRSSSRPFPELQGVLDGMGLAIIANVASQKLDNLDLELTEASNYGFLAVTSGSCSLHCYSSPCCKFDKTSTRKVGAHWYI